jgi:hypothetical protein
MSRITPGGMGVLIILIVWAVVALLAVSGQVTAHFGHRDHPDRSIVISEIGGS